MQLLEKNPLHAAVEIDTMRLFKRLQIQKVAFPHWYHWAEE
jgi:hypothetical protein